jgi:2-keto-4-pentenoate hydratase/2-oxohepta-3-ene-1,7-dioic acid hydratase in catechol pathway
VKVAQFITQNGPRVGIEHGRTWIDVGRAEAVRSVLENGEPVEGATTIEELLTRGRFDADELRGMVDFTVGHALEKFVLIPPGARMAAPLRSPRKILALGLNYALHAKEGNFTVPEEPIIFVKAGSSVIGPGETVRLPRGMGRMDHEVELGVVIGSRASGVSRKRAWKHVAGYTIVNDVSARDLQTKDLEKKHPWFRSKSFDTFTPLGPWIVTADEFRPPVRLDLECRVNGKLRQRANTADLLFGIPEIIEWVSRSITLEAGDVISTGTPEGIGPITHGDVMECSIEGIGTLTNPVRWR